MRQITQSAPLILQRGLSLVEVMIALLLGSLLTYGIVQIFTANSQTFRLTEADARAQEAGRAATDILSRALRNAGYFGCFPINGFNNNLNTADGDYSAALHDIRSAGIYAVNAIRPASAVNDTDFFMVSGARSNGISISLTAQGTDATSLNLSTQGGLAAEDIVLISDCANGDIVEVSDIQVSGSGATLVANAANGKPGNSFTGNSPAGCTAIGTCLSASYAIGSRVMPVYNEAYFIGESGGNRGLYLRDRKGVTAELVPGVVDMRVRFGQGSVSTGVDNWTNAAGVTNWSGVIAVQVSLLVQAGRDGLLPNAQTYCYPGWLACDGLTEPYTTASDRRLYRVYTFTTTLRNRV